MALQNTEAGEMWTALSVKLRKRMKAWIVFCVLRAPFCLGRLHLGQKAKELPEKRVVQSEMLVETRLLM